MQFVTTHEALGYLAAEYGLTQLGIEGLTPESEPSAARIQAASVAIHDGEAAPAVFYEGTDEGKRVGDAVAADVSVSALSLGTLESDPSPQDYVSLMDAEPRQPAKGVAVQQLTVELSGCSVRLRRRADTRWCRAVVGSWRVHRARRRQRERQVDSAEAVLGPVEAERRYRSGARRFAYRFRRSRAARRLRASRSADGDIAARLGDGGGGRGPRPLRRACSTA